MSKKPILSKHLKKLLALVLVCLITITLTGCDSSNRKPTGDIDLSATYASAKNYSVTVGDVYNKLRYNAVSYVEESVYKFLYEEEINTVKANPQSYAEEFEHAILHDIYGVHEKDEIEELSEKEVNIAISKYVDVMYQKGFQLTEQNVNEIKEGTYTSIQPYYYLEVAKHLAAKNKLIEDEFSLNEDGSINFGEITDESYFTKDEVVSWYDKNYKNTSDVTAILIRFIDNDEAKDVLKKFGLKSSGGKWYQIKLDPEKSSEWNTQNGYDEYYDDYKIDLTDGSGTVSIDELGNGNATVLKVFAEIYNYVYTYRAPIDFGLEAPTVADNEKHLQYYRTIEKIINEDFETAKDPNNNEYAELLEILEDYEEANDETIVMSKEKLDKYSSSLTSYVYNTLATKAEKEGEKFTQYITTAKSLGSYYYLLFKIAQGEDKVLYEEVENDDDTEINFTDTAFLNEILNEMFEDTLSDTFVSEKFTERVKEAKLKIYDSIVETQFMYNSSSALVDSYEKTKKQNNNVIAEVTYKDNTKEITVNDVYSYLEPLYGTQVATNLLFKQLIKETDYYKELVENEYDDYVETVKLMLYYFANDYYASSGYPSSIGKYNFMMLYYGTANVDEVVKDFLMVSDATNAYFGDFVEHGFTNTEAFYENLKTYAHQTYDDFYSLTVSGLSVYVDRDEDGKADEITDSVLLGKAKDLLEKAYDYVIKSNAEYNSALSNVVSYYNSSSRTDSQNPTSPESIWADYRSEGLYLEVTSFGTVTNATEIKDKAVQERLEEIRHNVVDEKLGFTAAYLDEFNKDDVVVTSDNKLTTLLVTNATLPTSAKYETENEEEKALYSNVNVIINDKKVTIPLSFEEDYNQDKVTLAQVKVYVSEYLLLGDVYSLPSTTIAALDAYLLPLIEKYTGGASQSTISNNVLGTITFSYNGQLSAEFNDTFKTNYTRSAFYNKYIEIIQNTEDGYDAVYTDWWTKMYPSNN